MADDKTSQASSASAGYRLPPASSRFRKGQSGNPSGRRKGSRNRPQPQGERLRSLMLEEAYRPITINENGKEIAMPMAQVVFRALALAAAKGEARAQAMFLKLVSATEMEEAAIEEMLASAKNETAPSVPVEISYRIVDPADRNTRQKDPPCGG